MRHVIHAVEVDIHDMLPVLRSNVCEQLDLRHAGVIHQHIDPAEILQHLLHRALCGSIVRHVRLHSRAAEFAADTRSLLRPGVVGEYHIVGTGEFSGDGAAYRAGAAGNKDNAHLPSTFIPSPSTLMEISESGWSAWSMMSSAIGSSISLRITLRISRPPYLPPCAFLAIAI